MPQNIPYLGQKLTLVTNRRIASSEPKQNKVEKINVFNPFHATGLSRFPLKTSESQRKWVICHPDFKAFASKESASANLSYFDVSPIFMVAVFKDNNLDFFRSKYTVIILQAYLLYKFKQSLQDDLNSIFFRRSEIKATTNSLLHRLYQKSLFQKSLFLLSRLLDWSNFLLHFPINAISCRGTNFLLCFHFQKELAF